MAVAIAILAITKSTLETAIAIMTIAIATIAMTI